MNSMKSAAGDSEKHQVRAARVSIAASAVMFLISSAAGIAADSITLILDASAGLVILATAILMHSSLRKVRLPPDHAFNFGYGKYEPFTVSIQNLLIVVTCVVSFKFAVQDIVHPENIRGYYVPTAAALVLGLTGLAVTGYLKNAGRKTGSVMLKTAGMHWQTDTVLSFGMCLGFISGLAASELGFTAITPYIDPAMAIALALYLVRAPLKETSRSVRELLDAAPEDDIRKTVKKVVDKHRPKSFGVYRLRARKAGEKIFVDVCFVMKGEMTLTEAAELAVNFEKDLKDHLPHADAVVHFRPAGPRE